EDFTTQRKNRLVLTVTTLFSRTTCRVTLDKEQFRFHWIAFCPVSKLTRQATTATNTLALHTFTRLFSCMTRLRCKNYFIYDEFRIIWILFEISLKHFAHHLAYWSNCFTVTKFCFGLTFKLWLRNLYRNHSRQSF